MQIVKNKCRIERVKREVRGKNESMGGKTPAAMLYVIQSKFSDRSWHPPPSFPIRLWSSFRSENVYRFDISAQNAAEFTGVDHPVYVRVWCDPKKSTK